MMQPIDLLVIIACPLLIDTSETLVEYVVERLAKLVPLLPKVFDRLGE